MIRVGRDINYMKNTYLVLTSDNGGAERKGKEIITDNYPLDKGKKITEGRGYSCAFDYHWPGYQSGCSIGCDDKWT